MQQWNSWCQSSRSTHDDESEGNFRRLIRLTSMFWICVSDLLMLVGWQKIWCQLARRNLVGLLPLYTVVAAKPRVSLTPKKTISKTSRSQLPQTDLCYPLRRRHRIVCKNGRSLQCDHGDKRTLAKLCWFTCDCWHTMAIFCKFRDWDKVPEENTLIFGVNRIPWDSHRILLG